MLVPSLRATLAKEETDMLVIGLYVASLAKPGKADEEVGASR